MMMSSPLCVLTGGPGTGKTFAVRVAVEVWRRMGRRVLLAAPTGRAASRMNEVRTLASCAPVCSLNSSFLSESVNPGMCGAVYVRKGIYIFFSHPHWFEFLIQIRGLIAPQPGRRHDWVFLFDSCMCSRASSIRC